MKIRTVEKHKRQLQQNRLTQNTENCGQHSAKKCILKPITELDVVYKDCKRNLRHFHGLFLYYCMESNTRACVVDFLHLWKFDATAVPLITKSSPEKTPGSPRSGNVTPTKSVRTPSPRSSSLRGRLLRAQQNNAVIQDALAYSRRKKDSVIITDEKKPVSEENLENTLKTDDVHIRDQTPEKTPKSPEKTPKSPEKTPKSPEKSFNAIELPINVKSPEKAYNAADYDVGGAQYNWW